MKIIFNNNEELVVNYFSVADGQMLIKTDFAESQTELENLFKDFLATRKITKMLNGENTSYENYTEFQTISRDVRTNEFTIVMALDGADFTSQIEALRRNNAETFENIKSENEETAKLIDASIEKINEKVDDFGTSIFGTNNELTKVKQSIVDINCVTEKITNSMDTISKNTHGIEAQLTNLQLGLAEIYEGLGV